MCYITTWDRRWQNHKQLLQFWTAASRFSKEKNLLENQYKNDKLFNLENRVQSYTEIMLFMSITFYSGYELQMSGHDCCPRLVKRWRHKLVYFSLTPQNDEIRPCLPFLACFGAREEETELLGIVFFSPSLFPPAPLRKYVLIWKWRFFSN